MRRRPHESPGCSCNPCLTWEAKEDLRPLPPAHRLGAAIAIWRDGLFTSQQTVQLLLELNRETQTDDTGETPVKPV